MRLRHHKYPQIRWWNQGMFITRLGCTNSLCFFQIPVGKLLCIMPMKPPSYGMIYLYIWNTNTFKNWKRITQWKGLLLSNPPMVHAFVVWWERIYSTFMTRGRQGQLHKNLDWCIHISLFLLILPPMEDQGIFSLSQMISQGSVGYTS